MGLARDNLERYARLALRVFERLRRDPEAYARFLALKTALTEEKEVVYDDKERSNRS